MILKKIFLVQFDQKLKHDGDMKRYCTGMTMPTNTDLTSLFLKVIFDVASKDALYFLHTSLYKLWSLIFSHFCTSLSENMGTAHTVLGNE